MLSTRWLGDCGVTEGNKQGKPSTRWRPLSRIFSLRSNRACSATPCPALASLALSIRQASAQQAFHNHFFLPRVSSLTSFAVGTSRSEKRGEKRPGRSASGFASGETAPSGRRMLVVTAQQACPSPDSRGYTARSERAELSRYAAGKPLPATAGQLGSVSPARLERSESLEMSEHEAERSEASNCSNGDRREP